ncbi:MAG: DUF3817 domain-containing protein [Myxococcales bacterium]|nr:DUF3817 domain-containing protein [Myxococcales bacterium]USN50974.1 MAG: DUF3817 domain-containing protein [Myxococcales bacterium]
MEKLFLFLGRLEGTSFLLLLFIAMPLKYYAHLPVAVKILGPVHGFLFLGYVVWALWCGLELKWSSKKYFLAFLAAVFPFGTFIFEKFYFKNKVEKYS